MEPSPQKIRGETRCIGKPHGWDESLDGPCGALSVRDEVELQSGVNFMHSEWRLQPGELKLLQDHNGVVVLRISGMIHPVVSLHVEARPTDDGLDMCVHGVDRGSYCGYCGGSSKGGCAQPPENRE